MQKITPFLWFDNNVEEAAQLYGSVFKNVKIGGVARTAESAPIPAGSVMSLDFEIEGQKFTGFNGGPMFKFSEAISFFVRCDTQEEIDYYWEKLTENGGQESRCGWLKDKFGLSWQIVPPVLLEMLSDSDREKSGRVMQAMMGMKKLDIAALKQAYEQG